MLDIPFMTRNEKLAHAPLVGLPGMFGPTSASLTRLSLDLSAFR